MLLEQIADKIDKDYEDFVARIPNFKTRDELENWLNEAMGDVGNMAKESYCEFLLGDDEKATEWMCSASAKAKACAIALVRFRYGLVREWPELKKKKKGKENGKHS